MTGKEQPDKGFTLIELLVVMIIIATLAAIAVPSFTRQRSKAHDASTKADVSNLAKEIATYFVDGKGTLILDYTTTPGKVIVTDGTFSTVVNLTNGTAAPVAGNQTNLGDPTGWCVALTDPLGAVKDFKYSAADGLDVGTC